MGALFLQEVVTIGIRPDDRLRFGKKPRRRERRYQFSVVLA